MAAAAQSSVTGIELTPSPNAIGIQWRKPVGVTPDHYNVYYATESILENNGRYLGREETLGNQTSLLLLDLANRGLQNGDVLYVTVTTVLMNDTEERTLAEEAHATLVIPTGTPEHSAGGATLEQVTSENETTVRLQFSEPVLLPEGHPSPHITIQAVEGEERIQVLRATTNGNELLLRTMPMTPDVSYTMTLSNSITDVNGSPLLDDGRTKQFTARASGGANTADAPANTQTSSGTTQEEVPVPSQVTTSSSSSTAPEPLPLPEPTEESLPTPDITPPEDARMLTLERVLQADGRYTVKANWQASLNTAGDLTAYHLYESDDEGEIFAGPTALLGTVLSTAIANIPPGTFTLKITAIDGSGNESAGIMQTIILPETGAATLLLSFGGAALYAFGRNRKKLPMRNGREH